MRQVYLNCSKVLTSILNQYFENNLRKNQLKIVICKAEIRCKDVLSNESHSFDKNEQKKMSRCVALRPVMNRNSLLNLIIASLPIDMIEMNVSPWIFIQNQY